MWIFIPVVAALPTTISIEAKDLLKSPETVLEKISTCRGQITKTHLLSEEKVHVGKIPATLITPKGYKREHEDKILLYIHGESTTTEALEITLPIAKKTGLKVLAIDYSSLDLLNTLNDLFEGYKEVIKLYKPQNVAMIADSQGASLALSTLIKLQDQKILLPASLTLLCPWLDRTQQGDSYCVFGEMACKTFNSKLDPNKPLLNPLNATLKAPFPPVFLQSGTRDASLSDSVRLFRKLKSEQIVAELDLFEGMWHGFERVSTLPEADLAATDVAHFLNKTLKI